MEEVMYKKVFVNCTFDLLHRGHLELLNYAKSLGDFLCVGIDTDDRVKEKKGQRYTTVQIKRCTWLVEGC